MPPFLPRKRLRSFTPEDEEADSSKSKSKSVAAIPRKPTLFDALDTGNVKKRTADQYKAALAGTDDESSLSDLSDEEFEDVPATKRQKTAEQSDDEDIEFEDVPLHPEADPLEDEPSGDLELTLYKDTRISLTNPHGTKKGPSKIERGIRVATHQMHVQLLMFHNAIRNTWLCDKEVQEILVKELSPMVVQEVEKWRRDSGLTPKEEVIPKGKSKAKGKNAKGKKPDPRSQREWGQPAERLESGQVNMSGGDPIFKLLRVLAQYWKNRYRITAPGLRKMGYKGLERLDEEVKSFQNDPNNPEEHGEYIKDIKDFRKNAKAMEGSRDVGAQLFTALLRGLGVEARMITNLQPVGFGWGKDEEALEKNPRKLKKKNAGGEKSSEDEEANLNETEKPKSLKGKGKAASKATKPSKTAKKPAERNLRGSGVKDAPIDLSDSELSDAPSEDDESVIDITPAKKRRLPSMPYDKDLLFPHYWTEVLSPVTNTYTAVDPVVLHVIAINPELLSKFEPRGAKADKVKQVISYIVGHSPDGTAKDVTTRYLKRQQWPGRTKGNRLPVEKIPIRNAAGKVKYYEEYDWFKHVMSGYDRGTKQCPRTEIDDREEATDLRPLKVEKKAVEEGKETLQSYKSSAQFVLERHMRREEAFLPGAKHVKTFSVKVKGQEAIDEKVYLRKDVVHCKTQETWHKEGRAPIDGEQPLKRVPYRAATNNRRRELAEAEKATGHKMLQGLYSREQTDWIIPPPIDNGVIPKNSFGNIDLYVDSMLPEGAAHIARRGTVKICRRLEIDYAEAVVGFDFGNRMAVPVINGVVVAIENYDAVMEQWEIDEAERVRKEDEKRTKTAIGLWRKMLMGLRIIERVQEAYGGDDDDDIDMNPFTNRKKADAGDKDLEAQKRMMDERDENMAGGFLPAGYEEEEVEPHHSESFFPVVHDEDEEGGGFEIEGHDDVPDHPNTDYDLAIAGPRFNTQPQQPTDGINRTSNTPMYSESEAEEAPAAKKRGRPAGSTNMVRSKSSTLANTKTKLPAKRPTVPKKAPIPPGSVQRKRKAADSEPEHEEEETSLSDPESEPEEKPKKAAKRGANRRASMPAKAIESSRKAPRRGAARKSETALKSHYFEHSNDDED